jgi:hypothetical protein
MKKKTNIILLLVVALIQFGAIAWLIMRYENVVKNGVECRFACQAYDPHDPFRGRFLRVRVEDTCAYDGGIAADSYRVPVWVKIDPQGGTNGLSKVVKCADKPEDSGLWVHISSANLQYNLRWNHREEDESSDDFYRRRKESGMIARIQFPDKFFLNERIARKAEGIIIKRMNEAVAVYKVMYNSAVLTDIVIGGKSILELARE